MFDESDEVYGEARKELLASGEFLYSADDVLRGYEIFRKRYINKQTAFKLTVGIIALVSSVFMIITEPVKTLPIICAAICMVCIAWFIKTPIENAKKTRDAAKTLSGDRYKAEIYADAARIVLLEDTDTTGDDPPTTIIHLDQYVADFLSADELYVIVVAKRYVFVIPKSAFSKEEQEKIEERLPMFLDSRYKVIR
jgi:hypothetical protein